MQVQVLVQAPATLSSGINLQLQIVCEAKLVSVLYSFWYIIAVIQMLCVLHVFGVKLCPSHDAKCIGS